ncbi:class I SAM-dependent methyltransferase [Lonsdalea quercina]|uniref:class I SAM-dependent methyltransferase n=1 Tax=Lonsdalea quercina TaxID=71657 RepID=UPI00397545D0
MDFTGERFIPSEDVEEKLIYEHYHRYEYVADFVKGKKVLDIASGEGFGSEILSRTASSVIGIDIDKETVDYAKDKYKDNSKIQFQCGSVTSIPLEDKSVDVIVSFETIEHISEHNEMLDEFKRVLKKDGLVIISTPDKKVYTDESGEVNKFHVKELYKQEFLDVLQLYFKNIKACGQRFLTLSSIIPFSKIAQEKVILGDLNEKNSVYIIAICSDSDISDIRLFDSLYYDESYDIYAKDKAMLRWASSVHQELMKSQRDYFRLEAEFNAYKTSIESKKNNNTDGE